MAWAPHLSLETLELPVAAEWKASFPGWCFFRINQGQGYWLGEPSSQEMNPGDMAVLSPLRDGYFLASQITLVTLDYFWFRPDAWIGFFTVAERLRFESLAIQPERAARVLPASHEAARQFARVRELSASANGLLLRCEMLEIVAQVFARELAHRAPPPAAVLPAGKRILVLMNQLPEAEFLKLSPREMASRCHCSLAHFTRLFGKAFGVSLRKKQQELRLMKAAQMLLETNASLDEVAQGAGFQHPEPFAAAFAKQFGVTPKAWRRPPLRRRQDKKKTFSRNPDFLS